MGKKKHHTGEQQTGRRRRRRRSSPARSTRPRCATSRSSWCTSRSGWSRPGQGLHRVRGSRRRRQGRRHQARSPSGSARACSGSSRCRRRPSARSSQMYMQRYMPHFPAGGEVVIFDRSWYNRAGVERVMGFCTEERGRALPRAGALVEQAMVDSGIILLKYWLEVSPRGADPAPRGPHRRRPQDLEAVADGPRSPTAAGTTTPGPATTMFAATDTDVRAVVRRRLQRQEAGAGSTSSATCSTTSRTRRDPRRRSSSPIVRRRATTASPSTRGGSSPSGSDRSCGQPDWSEYPGWVPSTTRRSFADASPLR